jgi:hypothetical protein
MNLQYLPISMTSVGISVISAFLVACAGGARTEEPAPMVVTEPVTWNGDVDLAPLLVRPELNALEMSAADRIEARIGALEFRERLGVAAEDTAAPWLVRLNALKLLAQRGATGELPVFVSALRARDERVRIAAVAGMREFMTLRPQAATEILAYALKDSSTRVQTAALQILADRDVAILRDFLPRAHNKDVRTITLDLIRAAEERGAPLARNAAGEFERTNAHGATLTFKPTQSWPQWDAAVGDVVVKLAGKRPVLIATGVEQVGSVVPAFFSSDGKTLVYEHKREIHARNLDTGEDRKLGDGIAPRMLPFTEDVVFLNEIRARRLETPNKFNLRYDVMRLPIAGGTPVSIGQLTAGALNELKGNYATVRWSRVQEQEGSFFLIGDEFDAFKLPSPFGE